METQQRRRVAIEAWAALLRAHAALVPRLDEALQQAVGMPLSWYDVLLELATAPDRRLRMSELGERVVLSRSRVSRIVDALAAAGLVSREENPHDGRSAFACLTKEGLARYRQAAPHYLGAIDEQFGNALTETELRHVAAALTKVAALA